MPKSETRIYKADVARKYRDKHGMEMPTAKLARIMYDKEKPLFKDVEEARKHLRYIEGKNGAHNRSHVRIKKYVVNDNRSVNPYNLPKSDETEFKPYPLKATKIALLCDIHVPYHNIEAITVALDYLKKEKPDAVVIDGDLFDFHALSRFQPDPRKKNFAQELAIGIDLLRIISKTLKCKIYYKLGNHDERYEDFLFRKAGELVGVEDFELKAIINRRLPHIEIIGEKRIIKANGLNIVHGHEFGKGIFSPVNIARGLFLRAKASVIGGHHHRTSEHTEQDINEKIITTWSVGCLCELHPAYLPINSWNHGFAVVELGGNGKEFHVHNKRIYKGKVL